MRTARAQQLSDLIGLIHDAAIDSMLWPAAIRRVRDLMQASSVLLFSPLHMDSPAGLIASCGLTEEFLRRYFECFHQHDVWTQAGLEKHLFSPGRVVTDEDLLPRDQLLASFYYREFLAPANISRLCCAVIFGQDDLVALPTVISIYRGVDASPFKLHDKNLLRLFVPHLTRSLNIMFRLQSTQGKLDASLLALNKMRTGVIVFDRDGRIVHMNDACVSLITKNEGLAIHCNPDSAHLSVDLPNALMKRLNLLIRETYVTGNATCTPHYFKFLGNVSKAPLVLVVIPAPLCDETGRKTLEAAAIGYLLEPDATNEPDMQLFSDVYKLTPAEIRLLRKMASGKTIMEIAGITDVSVETLKSQLKSIFKKTGAHRQSELIRMVSVLTTIVWDDLS
jgi:DNA-binding CsgD family transcriptional regulator/PAS domain-containing protein